MADPHVWITGASSGIGAAMAGSVPWPDAHVVDISRSGGTPGTEHVPADLSDPAAWRSLAGHFTARMAAVGRGRAVLVQAAGVLEPIGYAGEVDAEAYGTAVLVNGAAPQVLGDAFLRALDVAGHDGPADLVVLTSGAASSVYEGWSAYCAGKAAVDMWVRTTGAEQQRRHGGRRRVLAVGPGVVATDMQRRIRAADPHDFPQVDRFRSLHDDGELLDPSESARLVWSLVTGDAASGDVLDVRDAR